MTLLTNGDIHSCFFLNFEERKKYKERREFRTREFKNLEHENLKNRKMNKTIVRVVVTNLH
jgi:hypothetical protein